MWSDLDAASPRSIRACGDKRSARRFASVVIGDHPPCVFLEELRAPEGEERARPVQLLAQGVAKADRRVVDEVNRSQRGVGCKALIAVTRGHVVDAQQTGLAYRD